MSESHARRAAPDADQSGQANPKATRTVRFWNVPIVITLAVLAALAAFYLGGILNPMSNLRHFPIAAVNDRRRRIAANSQRPNVIGPRLNRHATVMRVFSVIAEFNAVLVARIFAPKGQPCRLPPPHSGASQPAAPG
jgi:hypothetical protein